MYVNPQLLIYPSPPSLWKQAISLWILLSFFYRVVFSVYFTQFMVYWLVSLTNYSVFKVPPCCSTHQSFIPFYCQMYSIIRMNHTLFTHFPVDGHLDGFRFWLWIILLWKFVYNFLCGDVFSFFLGLYRGADMLCRVVNLCASFQEAIKLFPK